MSLDEQRAELLEAGIASEHLDQIEPLLVKRVRDRYICDESYQSEEGDDPYPRRLAGILAKDYSLHVLYEVFGEKRHEINANTNGKLLKFAISIASNAINAEVNEVMSYFK
ncbi:MAG: hypothetical protein AAB836_01345 [Patescibacteria group bacterium]